ncbi:MAG TPA: asparagine synthase (glutamine-hydrolyzing) [Anaerolineales bacterium]|nr:asparagine synthase (glutamine-hydrolyzing) [Anaerolineales bacterium]
MCGICGKYSPTGVQSAELNHMLDTIAHRGPDDSGCYVRGNIGLGNRRLSIIDLQSGKQPISNEDRTIWVVYNGEMYNFPQLRRQLESKGHTFHTNSDTEAIVHLYEEFGEGCVEHISGMFAFALWDEREQKLLLARDRIGQKPLFYSLDGLDFYFGSEIKSSLALHSQTTELDMLAMHDYLSLRFISPPRTIFKHIQKLAPAHTLVFQYGQIRLRRYWQLSFREKLQISESEILDALQQQIRVTVSSHLLSDVPIGAFLSGGLDSSLIVAVLAQDLGLKPQTFSIGVDESDFDETPYARMVSEHHQTNHVEERVAANLVTSLPELIWHLDEPSDPIAACMFQAARLASRHVKVVLGGDGGDELFAGFDRYVGGRYIDLYNAMPLNLRQSLIGPILERLPDSFTYKSFTQKLRWVHHLSLQSTAAEQYAEATCFFRFTHEGKRSLYSSQLWKELGNRNSTVAITEPFNQAHADDLLDRMLYTDFITRLPEHSLVLTDRMSMAHGLETRSPFLDHELVEFLAKVPAKIKVQNNQPKYLMRKLAANYLPTPILQREKQGFMLPIAYWFRTDLFPVASQMLQSSYFVKEGWFKTETIQKLLDEHRSRRYDHHVRLWMLLTLELWHQLYIQGVDREVLREKLQELCLPQ